MDFVQSTLCLLRNSNQRKHVFRWLRSWRKDYLLKKKQPWLVFDAIDFLNSLPLEGNRVFEYGSGGSTLYWLSHNMRCVSVEHDAVWHALVKIHLDAASEIDYRLVPPEKSGSEVSFDAADPMLCLSDDTMFQGYTFRNYVSQIDAFPNDYFDVVSIDGRARPACIKHSVPKIKVNGLLILDNADRAYYTAKTLVYLRNFGCYSFYGVGKGYQMWGTNVYVRQK